MQATILSEKLRARNYPDRIIKKAQKRARNNNREALLEPTIRTPNDNQRLTCVTTYNVASTRIQKIVNKHWRILTSGNMDFEKPLFSYRRGQNLKDKLVHTRPQRCIQKPSIFPNQSRTTGHFACGSCSVCHLTKRTEQVKLSDDFTWTMKTLTNCNSERVIYLVTCPCGLQYVGMTTRKVKIRISEHRSNMRCKRVTTKMLTHFTEQRHGPNDFKWIVLEQLPFSPNLEQALLKKEQRWVFRLGTDKKGLNDQIPWTLLT